MYNFRDRLIKSSIWYCFFVFLTTETLSIFNLISKDVFYGLYLISAIGIAWIFKRNRFRIKFELKFNQFWKWYLLLSIVVFLPLFLIALYYPPNNWDSMTYHLSRVEHWIQNKNIEFYPTNNSRQLFLSPFAEYIILHWRILTGGDYLVNFVQYISMILSVLLSTMIVNKWKGGKMAQLVAAVLVATIPMGIMQSTSTQNDYVATFFVLASIYFYLKNEILFLALSVGLGIFTKSTFIIFVLPLGFYWFYTWTKKDFFSIWKKVLLILIFTLLINGSQWYRNYNYFGSILGPKDMSIAISNQSISPKYIISNIIRNIGTQIGLPNNKYNLSLDNLVENIHKNLGIKTNDAINSWYSEKYTTQFSIHEDLTGNFIIIMLFVITGSILLFKKHSISTSYLMIFLGWILFNIFFKWQPWHSRLELPFFISSCLVIAIIVVNFIKNKQLLKLFLLFLLITSLPFILGFIPFYKTNVGVMLNSNRPLSINVIKFDKSRYERFLAASSTNILYNKVILKIRDLDVKNIGLDLGFDSWEYPFWVAARYYKLNLNIHYLDNKNLFYGKNFNTKKNDVIITDNALSIKKIDKKKIKEIFTYENIKIIVLR